MGGGGRGHNAFKDPDEQEGDLVEVGERWAVGVLDSQARRGEAWPPVAAPPWLDPNMDTAEASLQ
jgi:hypothetical protein